MVTAMRSPRGETFSEVTSSGHWLTGCAASEGSARRQTCELPERAERK